MCKIQNKTGSDSRSNNDNENRDSEDNSEKFRYIKEANSKIKLIDVLRSYGFSIEQNYQRPTWSNNLACPFKSHKGAKERTPSFGYCFERDYFFCFGCNSSGRAVEFISLYEEVPRYKVAERILSQFEDSSTEDFSYEDNITPMLLNFSKFLQELIQKNKNNKEILNDIDKLIWWIDCYLMEKLSINSMDINDLSYRINRVKELLTNE